MAGEDGIGAVEEGGWVFDDEVPGEEREAECEAGIRKTRKIGDPVLPSPEEVAEHDKTHLPHRSWCRHCLRGRAVEMPHHQAVNDERGLPEVHLDFAFLGEEGEPGGTVPVLVARERSTRMTMSSVVPSKSTGTFIARRVVAFLREIGCEHGDMVVKSDQAPAIMAIVAEVGRLRAAGGGGRFITENSPVGSSASNGVVERAIRSVEQQTRCSRAAWKRDGPASRPRGTR
jgi:hypothetical protein